MKEKAKKRKWGHRKTEQRRKKNGEIGVLLNHKRFTTSSVLKAVGNSQLPIVQGAVLYQTSQSQIGDSLLTVSMQLLYEVLGSQGVALSGIIHKPP
jgi:hypothetical protein